MAVKAHPYPLIDIPDLRDDIGVKGDEFNDRLTRIIRGVTDAVETFCNRAFVKRTDTAKLLDGDGTVDLFLNPPVVSITSIDNDGTAVLAADYALYQDTGKVVLTDGTVWTKGNQKITITYVYGYAFDDLPSDVVMAAHIWAIHWWLKLKEKRMGVLSKSTGDSAISYVAPSMPDDVKELLSPHRLMGGIL